MSRGEGATKRTERAMPLIKQMHGQGASVSAIQIATGLSYMTVKSALARIDEARGHLVDLSMVPRHANGCVDMGGLNPVDGFWCSACGIATTVSKHNLSTDTMEPDWGTEWECIPKYCPICGRKIDWKGAA